MGRADTPITTLKIQILGLGSFLFALTACTTDLGTGQADALQLNSLDGDLLAWGTFSGRNDHVVSGRVELLELDGTHYLRLGSTFSLDGAPDPKVGFGRSDSYDTSTTFAPLASHNGEQTYRLPDGFELGSLNQATIWCDQFSVALGTADLATSGSVGR